MSVMIMSAGSADVFCTSVTLLPAKSLAKASAKETKVSAVEVPRFSETLILSRSL